MRQFIGHLKIDGERCSYVMHYDGNEVTITTADRRGYVNGQWLRLKDEIGLPCPRKELEQTILTLAQE